jgi:hypothetical protein
VKKKMEMPLEVGVEINEEASYVSVFGRTYKHRIGDNKGHY